MTTEVQKLLRTSSPVKLATMRLNYTEKMFDSMYLRMRTVIVDLRGWNDTGKQRSCLQNQSLNPKWNLLPFGEE